MNRIGVRMAAALAAVLLLGATACGGGSKDESSSGGDAIKATAESTTTTESTDDSSSDLDSLDDLDDLGALGGDCLSAAGAYATIGMSILTYMGGATESQIDELQGQVDELKGEIPSEIQADFQVFADGIAEYAAAMQGVDMSNILDPDVQDQLNDASEALDSSEFTEAQSNIDAYFSENCS